MHRHSDDFGLLTIDDGERTLVLRLAAASPQSKGTPAAVLSLAQSSKSWGLAALFAIALFINFGLKSPVP